MLILGIPLQAIEKHTFDTYILPISERIKRKKKALKNKTG